MQQLVGERCRCCNCSNYSWECFLFCLCLFQNFCQCLSNCNPFYRLNCGVHYRLNILNCCATGFQLFFVFWPYLLLFAGFRDAADEHHNLSSQIARRFWNLACANQIFQHFVIGLDPFPSKLELIRPSKQGVSSMRKACIADIGVQCINCSSKRLYFLQNVAFNRLYGLQLA